MSSANAMMFCEACGVLIGVAPGATEQSAPSMAIECVECWSRRPMPSEEDGARFIGSTAPWAYKPAPKLRLKFPESVEPMTPISVRLHPRTLRPAPAFDEGAFASPTPSRHRMPTMREWMDRWINGPESDKDH